jgi:hypothetical protein
MKFGIISMMVLVARMTTAFASESNEAQIEKIKAALFDQASLASQVTYAGQSEADAACLVDMSFYRQAQDDAAPSANVAMNIRLPDPDAGLYGFYDAIDMWLTTDSSQNTQDLKVEVKSDLVTIGFTDLWSPDDLPVGYASYYAEIGYAQDGAHKLIQSVEAKRVGLYGDDQGKETHLDCSGLKPMFKSLTRAQEHKLAQAAYKKYAKSWGPLMKNQGGCVVATPTQLNCEWSLETDYTADTLKVKYKILKNGAIGKVIDAYVEPGC